MNVLRLRIYTDEDVDARVAVQLRQRGHDVVACREAGNAGQGLSDDWQLAFATGQSRAILTHNMGDFARLANAWHASGRRHAGIVIATHAPIGVLVRRVEAHLMTFAPEYQDNILLLLAE